MNPIDTPHRSSSPSDPAPHQIRPQRLLLSIGAALLALIVTWAVVAAYSTTADVPQCSDNGTSPSVMSCNWVNGQMSNANWLEGSAVPQKAHISGLSAAATSVHSYTWSVTWSDSNKHGYDWIVSYGQAQQLHPDYIGSPLDLNPCTSGTNTEKTTCLNLRSGPYSQTIDIPDDAFVSGIFVKDGATLPRIQAFESKYGNRTMTLWTDAPLIIGLIVFCGLDPASVCIGFGTLQIATGLVYGIPIPVQPLKAMATIMLAQRYSPGVLAGGGLVIGAAMLVLAATGSLDWIARVVPTAVVRGIQLGLGLMLARVALGDYMKTDGTRGYVLAAVALGALILLRRQLRVPAPLVVIGLGALYAFAFHFDGHTWAGVVGLSLPRRAVRLR